MKKDIIILYRLISSGYKDYIQVNLGDTRIFQLKTNAENFEFIKQELQFMIDSINTLPFLLNALKSLQGLEPWIGNRQMKEHFQKEVYSALNKFKETLFSKYIESGNDTFPV